MTINNGLIAVQTGPLPIDFEGRYVKDYVFPSALGYTLCEAYIRRFSLDFDAMVDFFIRADHARFGWEQLFDCDLWLTPNWLDNHQRSTAMMRSEKIPPQAYAQCSNYGKKATLHTYESVMATPSLNYIYILVPAMYAPTGNPLLTIAIGQPEFAIITQVALGTDPDGMLRNEDWVPIGELAEEVRKDLQQDSESSGN